MAARIIESVDVEPTVRPWDLPAWGPRATAGRPWWQRFAADDWTKKQLDSTA
jgi:hypothetical protein